MIPPADDHCDGMASVWTGWLETIDEGCENGDCANESGDWENEHGDHSNGVDDLVNESESDECSGADEDEEVRPLTVLASEKRLQQLEYLVSTLSHY
jgi:hypothetical protein